MAFYRHRPTVIEARQFDGSNGHELAGWCGGRFAGINAPVIFVETLEGTMTATPGMWILHGIRGEWYPVSDEVFQAAYEPARVPDGVGTGAE